MTCHNITLVFHAISKFLYRDFLWRCESLKICDAEFQKNTLLFPLNNNWLFPKDSDSVSNVLNDVTKISRVFVANFHFFILRFIMLHDKCQYEKIHATWTHFDLESDFFHFLDIEIWIRIQISLQMFFVSLFNKL